jgi:hypothetical protein
MQTIVCMMSEPLGTHGTLRVEIYGVRNFIMLRVIHGDFHSDFPRDISSLEIMGAYISRRA